MREEVDDVSDAVGVPGLGIAGLDNGEGGAALDGCGDAVRVGNGGTGGGGFGERGLNDLLGIGVPGAGAGERARIGVEEGVVMGSGRFPA